MGRGKESCSPQRAGEGEDKDLELESQLRVGRRMFCLICMRLFYRCLAILVGSCGIWLEALAAAPQAPFTPEFKFSAPLSATLLAAQKAGIPMNGFDAPPARAELRTGDYIVAVVSRTDKGSTEQYVMQLSAVDLTEKDKKLPPIKDVRYYTNSGNEFNFAGKWVALSIRMLGPIKSDAKDVEKAASSAKDKQVHVVVNVEYLRLGFDQACDAWLRLAKAVAHLGTDANYRWGAQSMPFSAEQLKSGRAGAEKIGVTAADERALTGTLPALMEFFTIVLNSGELQSLIRDVADIPWFSLIRNIGGNYSPYVKYVPPFSVLDSASWKQAPEVRAYCMPLIFSLANKPVLACRFAVTAPKPPLLTSAGIIGIAAQRPDGKGPHLMIQIVATRCASENLEKISVK